MEDPYVVLDLSYGADDKQIRARYLELVRRYPPEREPQKAAEIRAAYDALRDPVVRLKNQLFDAQTAMTFERLVAQYKPDVRSRRLPTKLLLSLGQT